MNFILKAIYCLLLPTIAVLAYMAFFITKSLTFTFYMAERPIIKKLLGYAAVDSGQLIIVDPCYLKSWKDGSAEDTTTHYGKACDITNNAQRGGEITVSHIAGNGVVFGTGGDGNFAVYAHYRQDKTIAKITIENLY